MSRGSRDLQSTQFYNYWTKTKLRTVKQQKRNIPYSYIHKNTYTVRHKRTTGVCNAREGLEGLNSTDYKIVHYTNTFLFVNIMTKIHNPHNYNYWTKLSREQKSSKKEIYCIHKHKNLQTLDCIKEALVCIGGRWLWGSTPPNIKFFTTQIYFYSLLLWQND